MTLEHQVSRDEVMLTRLPADGLCRISLSLSHTHTRTHTHLHLPLESDVPAIPVMLLLRQTGFVVLPSAGVMLYQACVCVCVSVCV